MKICWDNLEKIRYNPKTGKIGGMDESEVPCKNCGEDFLKTKKNSKFCSRLCLNTHNAKNRSEETREKLSKALKGRTYSKETLEKLRQANLGEKNPMFGKKVSEETREKLRQTNWKGDYYGKGLPTYDSYINKLKQFHECRRNEKDPNILEVRCTYCGKWYIPKVMEVANRIKGIYYEGGGRNLYCSEGCKRNCPIYNQTLYPKGFQLATSREVQPELRKLVFERDNYTCIKCSSTSNLHCHHVDPVINNPIESADVNNCLTLCYNCHREIHKQPGCTYSELKCF